jgi:hypothetical protein
MIGSSLAFVLYSEHNYWIEVLSEFKIQIRKDFRKFLKIQFDEGGEINGQTAFI